MDEVYGGVLCRKGAAFPSRLEGRKGYAPAGLRILTEMEIKASGGCSHTFQEPKSPLNFLRIESNPLLGGVVLVRIFNLGGDTKSDGSQSNIELGYMYSRSAPFSGRNRIGNVTAPADKKFTEPGAGAPVLPRRAL